MKHDLCSGVLNVNHPYSDFILTESSVSSTGNCLTKIVLSKMYLHYGGKNLCADVQG